MFSRIRDSYSFFKLFYNIYYTDFDTITPKEIQKLKQEVLDNGSISIKFMQWYITKLINIEEDNQKYKNLIKEFEDIFDNCPYHSDEETNEMFKKSFGYHLNDVILEGTLKRIASGSIGQVYRATLIDGRDIAIKVRHPNIEELKNNQMLLINLITSLQGFSYFRNNLNLFMDIEDFMENLNLQIDFKNEAFNNLLFYQTYRDYKKVIIPKIYYYSNDIIISEFCDGLYYHEIENQYIRRKVAINFVCFNLESAVFNNFMHADLHSRNWKVQENHRDSKIIIYDFGICFKSISSNRNRAFWEAIQDIDLERIVQDVDYLVQSGGETITLEDLNELDFFKENKFEMSILMKKLRYIFVKKSLRVTKLFMNFMVWISLFEDIIKESGCFITDESKQNKNDITQHQRASIIAYCETAKCYPQVLQYMKEKYNNNTISNIFEYDNGDLEFSDPEDLVFSEPEDLQLSEPEDLQLSEPQDLQLSDVINKIL
jgi:predicted unusual protein kinase regulating ubiquinone biosynthesis (AarF/ABC1/UbiB family)